MGLLNNTTVSMSAENALAIVSNISIAKTELKNILGPTPLEESISQSQTHDLASQLKAENDQAKADNQAQ